MSEPTPIPPAESSSPSETPADGGSETPADGGAAVDPAALNIVKRNALWAMGVGLVPLPVLDVLGVSAVQLKMVRELAEHHGVSFSETDARSLIGALLGGLGSVTAAGFAFSLLKVVPVVGHTAAAIALPATVGATTYALGKVFTQHFAQGGSLRDLDPATMAEYFRKEYQDAKHIIRDLRKGSRRG
jgi:uncharacterized protein (DUF697 family)